jgi:hypothetical protein
LARYDVQKRILINNDLSVSGGSDKTNAVLNMGYLDNSRNKNILIMRDILQD